MAIYRGAGGTGDANSNITVSTVTQLTIDAQDARDAAQVAQAAAEAAEANATADAAAASTSESNASLSASAAADSAVLADTGADSAEEWAVKPEDTAVSVNAGGDGSTTFSALHWAAKSSASASAASTSETNAANSAAAIAALDPLVDADIGVTVQGYDATILNAADIGVTVQGYDATTVVGADIANMLETTDIGVTVQAYDADTAKTDVAQTYTASQRGTVTTDNDLSYDMAAGNNFVSAVSATGTLTFTNITAGQSGNITMTVTGTPVISAAASVRINATELSRLSTAGVYRISYYSPDGTNVDVSVSSSLTAGGA